MSAKKHYDFLFSIHSIKIPNFLIIIQVLTQGYGKLNLNSSTEA